MNHDGHLGLDGAGVISRTLDRLRALETAEADSPQSTGGHGESTGADRIAIAAMEKNLNVRLLGRTVEEGDSLVAERRNQSCRDGPMFFSDGHKLSFCQEHHHVAIWSQD